MSRYAGLYDEFGAALQFPAYFGENSAALDECLSDLEWLPTDDGYIVIVRDADIVMIDEGRDGVEWLCALLTRVRSEWAIGVTDGEYWDRPWNPLQRGPAVRR